jgi:Ni/Fe-hydrogenase subunit HybB-like protein
VIGTALAVLGVVTNRWNITVTGLFVPLAYSPGTLYQLEPVKYLPSLVEWGVVIGIIGYALTLLTLGVRFLPLFPKEELH